MDYSLQAPEKFYFLKKSSPPLKPIQGYQKCFLQSVNLGTNLRLASSLRISGAITLLPAPI